MKVDGYDLDSLLLELGVDGEMKLSERGFLTGHLGFLMNFKETGNWISGRYVGGGTPVSVWAPGGDEQALDLGLGTWLDLSTHTRVGMSWRSELRDSSPDLHLLSLGATVGF